MSKTTTTDLSAKVEDLTEMLNRVLSVIRANNVDRSRALDPKGLLQMSKEEYAAEQAKLQKISDEHDARQKQITHMSSSEIDEMISDLETAQLSNALSGLSQPQTA